MSGALVAILGTAGAPGIINGSLPNGTEDAGGGTDVATWQLQDDGDYAITNNDSALSGDWVTPSETSVAALYQVRVDPTSGSFTDGPGAIPSASTGTYLDCSTTRSWFCNSGSVTFDVSFREKASGL